MAPDPPSKILTPSDKRRWRSAPSEKGQVPTESATTAPQSAFSFDKATSKDKDRHKNQNMALPGLLNKERSKMISQWKANGDLAERQEAARSKNKPGLGNLQCTLSFKDWMECIPLSEGGKGPGT